MAAVSQGINFPPTTIKIIIVILNGFCQSTLCLQVSTSWSQNYYFSGKMKDFWASSLNSVADACSQLYSRTIYGNNSNSDVFLLTFFPPNLSNLVNVKPLIFSSIIKFLGQSIWLKL
jgi:hypothetical protein